MLLQRTACSHIDSGLIWFPGGEAPKVPILISVSEAPDLLSEKPYSQM